MTDWLVLKGFSSANFSVCHSLIYSTFHHVGVQVSEIELYIVCQVIVSPLLWKHYLWLGLVSF